MASRPAYPPDLARFVEEHWPAKHPLRVSTEVLDKVLAVAFHASLTLEEGRPTRFRLLLTDPAELPSDGAPNHGVLRLLFERPRSFHADELRRLAPAVPFETSLIGVHLDGPDLRVWGIAHSGPAWLAPSWGGRDLVPNWTNDPIIHATGPGQLAVRCAGQVVGAIDRGLLLGAMIDVFDARWLSAIFASERAEVRARHAELQAETPSPTAAEDSLVGRVTQQMLRRAIRLIRQAQHGGLILIVDAGSPPDHLDGLRLKYPIGQDEPSHRYRSLLLRLLHAVAASTSKASAGWEDFAENESTELRELEQAVFEWSRVIANLAEIDGAVVVDKRFALIGFGAEVSGDLPTPSRIWRALDTEGGERRPDDVERVGTRHRAAYRFVNRHPGALAVVISHDGAVSFVAKHGLDVVFWEQSMSP